MRYDSTDSRQKFANPLTGEELDYLVNRARDLPELREDKINEIRRLLYAGEYDTQHGFQETVNRLSDEFYYSAEGL